MGSESRLRGPHVSFQYYLLQKVLLAWTCPQYSRKRSPPAHEYPQIHRPPQRLDCRDRALGRSVFYGVVIPAHVTAMKAAMSSWWGQRLRPNQRESQTTGTKEDIEGEKGGISCRRRQLWDLACRTDCAGTLCKCMCGRAHASHLGMHKHAGTCVHGLTYTKLVICAHV